MSKTIFEENQRFNQPLVWIGVILALSLCMYQFIKVEGGSDFIIPFAILGMSVLLLLSIRLKTRIDEHGVHVQMFPFHLKYVTYKWSELYSAEAVKYSPLGDYGGWGVRISFRGKGKAFNVRGDKGIKLVTADGKTRMIGTQKMEEAQLALAQYKDKIN